MKIVMGADLPAGGAFLPSPDDLVVRVSSGRAPGLANDLTVRDFEELSGSPGCPADPDDEEALGPDLDFNAPRRIPILGNVLSDPKEHSIGWQAEKRDDDYVDLLEAAHLNGHVTDQEASEAYQLHKLVAGARRPAA